MNNDRNTVGIEKIPVESRRSRLIALCAVAGFAFAVLPACNTVSGLGEDLQESSDNVKEAIGGSEDPDID